MLVYMKYFSYVPKNFIKEEVWIIFLFQTNADV